MDQVKEELQQKYLVQNTAKMNVDRAKQQRNESEAVFTGLMGEKQQIEQQIEEIDNNKKQILDEIEYSKKREQEINEEANEFQKILEEQAKLENEASQKLSNIQLETANIKQKVEFAQVNIDRINGEVEKFDVERADLLENAAQSKEDAKKKQQDIEEVKKLGEEEINK